MAMRMAMRIAIAMAMATHTQEVKAIHHSQGILLLIKEKQIIKCRRTITIRIGVMMQGETVVIVIIIEIVLKTTIIEDR